MYEILTGGECDGVSIQIAPDQTLTQRGKAKKAREEGVSQNDHAPVANGDADAK